MVSYLKQQNLTDPTALSYCCLIILHFILQPVSNEMIHNKMNILYRTKLPFRRFHMNSHITHIFKLATVKSNKSQDLSGTLFHPLCCSYNIWRISTCRDCYKQVS